MKTDTRGLTIDHDVKREALGQRSWILHICKPTGISEYERQSLFFDTEAERDLALAEARPRQVAAYAALALVKAQHKALHTPPPLPVAPKGCELFESMALRWLETKIKPPRKKASTYKGYGVILRKHLFPVMRALPVTPAVMTVPRLTDILGRQLYARGLHLERRLACQRVLSGFFRWTLKQHVLTYNPVTDLCDEIKQDDEFGIDLEKKPNPMTDAQRDAFLAWQQEHHPEYYPLFVWLAFVGSRISEACALQWDNVKLEHEQAYIVQTFSAAQRAIELQAERAGTRHDREGKGLQPTKTERTNQYIHLHPLVVQVMAALRVANKEGWLGRGRYGAEPTHCFLNSYGEPLRPSDRINQAFKAGCTALGLVGDSKRAFKGPHALRATFITIAILDGHDIGMIARHVGHEGEGTIKQHYYKWIQRKAGNPFAQAARK